LAKSKKEVTVERAAIFNGHNPLTLEDPEALALYPNVCDVLLPKWKAGAQTRQRGKVTIVPLGAAYRVTVDCPTEVLETSVMLATLIDVLGQLEAFLASGKAVWTPGYQKHRKALPTVDAVV
jgi:hypothetical protein